MKNAIYIGIFVVYFLFIIITSLRSSKKVETMSDFTTGGSAGWQAGSWPRA